MGKLLGLLGLNKMMLLGGAAILVSAGLLFGIMTIKLSRLETKNALLQQQIIVKDVKIKGLEGTIRVKTFTARLLEDDLKALRKHVETTEQAQQGLSEFVEGILNADPSEDGPVSPILNRVIDAR